MQTNAEPTSNIGLLLIIESSMGAPRLNADSTSVSGRLPCDREQGPARLSVFSMQLWVGNQSPKRWPTCSCIKVLPRFIHSQKQCYLV